MAVPAARNLELLAALNHKPGTNRSRRLTRVRHGGQDVRGQKRSNDAHAAATPDAQFYRKRPGKEAKPCFMGHALMENRRGLIAGALATRAPRPAERLAAPHRRTPRGQPPRAAGAECQRAAPGHPWPHHPTFRPCHQPADQDADRGGVRLGQEDQASLDGDAQPAADGTLTGEIRFHRGAESAVTARRCQLFGCAQTGMMRLRSGERFGGRKSFAPAPEPARHSSDKQPRRHDAVMPRARTLYSAPPLRPAIAPSRSRSAFSLMKPCASNWS